MGARIAPYAGLAIGELQWPPGPLFNPRAHWRCLPSSLLKETERGMSLRLALFWREHGRGSRITCLSSEGSSECWICSMSVTDLAPFRLPLKEVLRESDLTWEGRGMGESAPTLLERVDVVLTCMEALVA